MREPIVSGGSGTADAKIAAMEDAGVVVAKTPSDMGTACWKPGENKAEG